ncbi:MAG: DUF2156 domain-containing protein [Phycisphaerales bacterium]|nr:MAG: DUF2156 domain-containing protein [Phycisphaerales bacterium]
MHERFKALPDGISEFTFASIYLFRDAHKYGISKLNQDSFVIVGRDADPFFMLPFGLPERTVLDDLFGSYNTMKCVAESQCEPLSDMGYHVVEDRDNFDYLYLRQDLVQLAGRKLHKKKNLINLFVRNHTCVAKPLLEDYTDDAMRILENWKHQRDDPGDYLAAKEALERMEQLQLCGGIFYVENEPVAYCLGEELALGKTFVIHFEKAVAKEEYKGVYQFINQVFASVLPDKYETINREQDLGDLGLRQAKASYKPVGFVKKYKATK